MGPSSAATGLSFLLLSASGMAWPDAACEQAVRQLDYAQFVGDDARCAGHRQDFCARLANLDAAEFAKLSSHLRAGSEGARQPEEKLNVLDAFAACGLDFDMLHYRQCQQAFRQENLDFVLSYCPGEAWSLARAQCERRPETVSSRYAQFCARFYKGMAPGTGAR